MKIQLLIILNLPLVVNLRAGSATWNLNPTSGDWNTAANWTPATVPNGATDLATFGVPNTTNIDLSAGVQVDSIVFNPGASDYSLTLATGPSDTGLTIGGVGIVNNSGATQTFILPRGSLWLRTDPVARSAHR
jgi:hypothetical protein